MITIEQRGKNLWDSSWLLLPNFANHMLYQDNKKIIIQYDNWYYANVNYLFPVEPNKSYVLSFTTTLIDTIHSYSIITAPYNYISKPEYMYNAFDVMYSERTQNITAFPNSNGKVIISFTAEPNDRVFILRLLRDGQTIIPPTTLSNFQLEEGSVATPYEDPWVNTLNFDEALMSGEQIQQDGNKFYLVNNWHRTNKDPYESVTFSGGTATLGESSETNSSIVVDIDTGEVKNSLNSGTTVQVYLNQYDSWTTDNATTTAFNLTKVSLTNDYPVAVDGNVTTSGFSQSTTQIVFDNPIASGSSVSCVYPYLDTNYNSQAKVFYKKTSTSRDEVTYTGFPFELTDGINHIAIQDQLPAQLDVEADDVDTAQSISFPTDLTVNEEDVLKETDTKDHRRNSLRLTRKVTGSIARLQDSTFLEDFKDVQFRVHYHNVSTDGVLLDEYLLHTEFTKNSSNLLAKDLTDSRDFVAEKKVIQHA